MKGNESYSARVWQQLKKNVTAMVSLFLMLMMMLAGIFAYLIVPDKTPGANFQTVEIQLKPAGYEQLFFKQLSEKKQEPHRTYLKNAFSGRPESANWIPVNGYRVDGDLLHIERYVDEDSSSTETFRKTEGGNFEKKDIAWLFEKRKYPLGTDGFGRDILSRLIIGSRVSISIGLAGALLSLLIGILLGTLSGYYRGKVDAVIGWLLNVNWSIPSLLLMFAITLLLGKGFWQIMLAIGLSLWVNVARLVRGQVMVVKEMEYVEAARALGFSDMRIILRHILPNISGPLLVTGAANFATAIILESGLSFLGLGMQPPSPSWGLMMREHYNFIITNNPLPALIPGLAIMLLVLSVNLIGNGLRDAVDVRN